MHTHSDSPLGHGTPWPIWAIGGLLALTLAVVAWQSQIGGGPVKEDVPSVQWQRSLRFEDRPNGDIAVLDASSQREVAHFQGEQGFLRGSLRALARERQRPRILRSHQLGCVLPAAVGPLNFPSLFRSPP
jgi:putative photosynthetic complex assembly protein